MQKFLIGAAVFFCAIVLINVGLDLASRKTQRAQLLSRLEEKSEVASPNVLFFGNSLMDAAYSREVFDGSRDVRTLDAPLGQSGPLEHALILRHVLEHQPTIRRAVYGYFDDQLNQEIPVGFADLVGNRALAYSFPNTAADLIDPRDSFLRMRLSIVSVFPMIRERSTMWMRVEKLRRQLEEIGMPVKKRNRFGRIEDFAMLDTPVEHFVPRARAIIEERRGLSRPIRDLFRTARAHDVELVIVEMPMPAQHRSGLYATPEWIELRALNRRWIAKEGGRYITATDWIADSGFTDALHMNDDGARRFSERMLEEVRK